jgi:hypothetical protein
MWKKLLLVLVSLPLCVGASCNVSCGGTPLFPDVNVELDLADCVMRITQGAGATEAMVTATITDGHGRPVELAGGQTVSVNGQTLSGAGINGVYTGLVAVANEYAVTVNEPTRGVETTTIAPPADFDITSPADGGSASLSGFTLNWSNADAGLQVTVLLTQTLFGDEERETFGPFTDTGSLVLDAQNLSDFQQGANLLITVTKINERSTINGFNSGPLSVERSETSLVAPGS